VGEIENFHVLERQLHGGDISCEGMACSRQHRLNVTGLGGPPRRGFRGR
jgi:hypothetical protein